MNCQHWNNPNYPNNLSASNVTSKAATRMFWRHSLALCSQAISNQLVRNEDPKTRLIRELRGQVRARPDGHARR